MRHHPLSIALAFALASSTVLAGNADSADQARQLDTVVVQSQITYRDRTEATAPTLSYDLEFFQRFEPLTVGDMLKRVPSMSFVSDVLEFDGARLRGLDPGYTQILINGKKVPGAGDDRSFFVDRIPAELVERIEIVRSASANRSGDAMAGTLNIVLRDAYEFDGAYIRAGALAFSDGEVKPSLGAVSSGEIAGGRLLAGVNLQGRYNPKDKLSLRYDEPEGELDNREDQSDTRDGSDYSANLSFERALGDDAELSLDGVFVRTDREEREHSEEFNTRTGSARANLLSINDQLEDIDQSNYSMGAKLEFAAFGGDNEISASLASFSESTVSTEEETGYDDDDSPPSFDEFEGTRQRIDIDDKEHGIEFEHQHSLGSDAEFEFGIDYRSKQRDNALAVSEVDTDQEGAPLPPYVDFDRLDASIEERRLDPYLMLTGTADALAWETGLRYESTDVEVSTLGGDRFENDFGELLPSAHLRWDLSDASRVTTSLARTLRRPNFNFLNPTELEGEYGDNDFIGNPLLEPETAWGLDIGFEHRLGRQGVVGVNLFYRDVSNLIEIVNTGAPSAESLDDYEDDVDDFLDENPGADASTPGYPVFNPDSFVYSAANVGEGSVYGVEFDLSTPLTALGLPDTGIFVNYSWLDSEIDDALGSRTFNDQAQYVYNVGFIHDLSEVGMSFGLSYRKQGEAYSRLLAEEVTTTYGGDLEAFVEKRFGEHLSIRLTGSNLLDASKDERFNKFNTLAEQIDRDFDEYEIETESSGPVYQLIARYAF